MARSGDGRTPHVEALGTSSDFGISSYQPPVFGSLKQIVPRPGVQQWCVSTILGLDSRMILLSGISTKSPICSTQANQWIWPSLPLLRGRPPQQTPQELGLLQREVADQLGSSTLGPI